MRPSVTSRGSRFLLPTCCNSRFYQTQPPGGEDGGSRSSPSTAVAPVVEYHSLTRRSTAARGVARSRFAAAGVPAANRTGLAGVPAPLRGPTADREGRRRLPSTTHVETTRTNSQRDQPSEQTHFPTPQKGSSGSTSASQRSIDQSNTLMATDSLTKCNAGE